MAREYVRFSDYNAEITVIDKASAEYPYKLRNIDKPPERLYCIGDISRLNNTGVAIVGSRKFTVYGKQVSKMIGRRLSEAGVSVVSGLAKGIDAFAHEGALEVPSSPIAVLGTGLRQMYPHSNLGLMREVAKTGLVVSEYPPDFKGQPWSFPMRNRIISGLSEAVVLVEANANSGALITAQYAMEQGKTIFAVPGNINSHFSMGTNQLIRDGAFPLIVIDDILTNLGIEIPEAGERALDLSNEEMALVKLLKENGGARADYIAKLLGRKVSNVSSMLTILEIRGIVVSTAGKFYLAK